MELSEVKKEEDEEPCKLVDSKYWKSLWGRKRVRCTGSSGLEGYGQCTGNECMTLPLWRRALGKAQVQAVGEGMRLDEYWRRLQGTEAKEVDHSPQCFSSFSCIRIPGRGH